MREHEKAHMGQTIRTETGPDKSSHKTPGKEHVMGRKMGGGHDNLGHSIAGARAGDPNANGKKGRSGC